MILFDYIRLHDFHTKTEIVFFESIIGSDQKSILLARKQFFICKLIMNRQRVVFYCNRFVQKIVFGVYI